ncbi:glycosyltransferase family protein [Arcticibacter sp. MXS-1]|uniref:glycosyltransferase family protein n=1 Tax=Arcticibacter sp. MXS-1 TaxID=3341726 RepID=UPI0035A903B0
MKILYAIQGTGNGHLSRAMDIVPCLQRRGLVDVLVSGIQGDLILPFPVRYQLRGLSFIFGKSGGVDFWQTFVQGSLRKLISEVRDLPVEKYDLVISDFEPVTAWACRLKKKKVVALSHQSAVLAPKSPRALHTDWLGKWILKHYAPSDVQYGFHFNTYDSNIFTPVIRQQVRHQEINDRQYYTVYLPSYEDKRLISILSRFKDIRWDVFSKHNKYTYMAGNINVQPVSNEAFIKSMASASGVLCGAGFETPAEALYMGKKLLVVPMKNQYEQHLNAAALSEMGVPVISALDDSASPRLSDWLQYGKPLQINYPDITRDVVDLLLDTEVGVKSSEVKNINIGTD